MFNDLFKIKCLLFKTVSTVFDLDANKMEPSFGSTVYLYKNV